MGTVSNVIAGGTEGAVQQGPVRARGPLTRTFSAEEKDKGYKRTFVQPISYSRYTKGHLLTSSNHYTNAKDIWENVKMILKDSELTKDDRESQLYDEFEHFRQIKGETIQGYYLVYEAH
ncbi:hypothetical protein Tco_0709346 [Tanacetum coccineum]